MSLFEKKVITDEEFKGNIERLIEISRVKIENREYLTDTVANRIDDKIDKLTRKFFKGRKLESYAAYTHRLKSKYEDCKKEVKSEICIPSEQNKQSLDVLEPKGAAFEIKCIEAEIVKSKLKTQ